MNYGVYARPNSPFWWIYYYTGPKNRVQESSKKPRADPLGWKHAHDLAKAKAGEFAALESVGSKGGLWDVWVEDWLLSRLPNDNQLKSRRTVLQHWRFIRAFLGSKGVDAPVGLTYGLAMEYFEWRKTNKRLPSRPKVQTAVTEMALLKRVMNEAVRRGFVPANPLSGMELVRPRHREKPEITPDEEAVIRRALAAREGHLPLTERWMTISFEISIRHGWRMAETSFPLSRIDFDAWKVLVHQKGDRWRTVPVHPELRPMFTELKRLGATLSCVWPKNNVQRAAYAWSLLLRGCERDNVKGLLPHLCFHCCRVTVISRMARAGVAERLVMEWVGHASTAVHRIYQRVRTDDLDRCILPSGASIDLGPPPSDARQTSASAPAKP